MKDRNIDLERDFHKTHKNAAFDQRFFTNFPGVLPEPPRWEESIPSRTPPPFQPMFSDSQYFRRFAATAFVFVRLMMD